MVSPGMVSNHYSQATGSPTVLVPLSVSFLRPYPPYGQSCIGGCLTIRVGMRPTPSVGRRSGSVLQYRRELLLFLV